MTELFASHSGKHSAILLIDASGSVVGNRFNDRLVFDKIKNVIDNLEETEYWVIFWNSNWFAHEKFTNGIFKLPFPVKKTNVDQPFTMVKGYINNKCLTFPHLAFNSIPDEWISKTDFTRIYFITDGEMGYADISYSDKNDLKNALSGSIRRLFEKFNNIQLNIITVEPRDMDFTQIETLRQAAGCDVYNVIMENHLTKYVTKFISYTLNNTNGFVHINKNIAPPGFVPFGDKFFSELKVGEFIHYLRNLIGHTTDQDELLKIVQSLSTTLCTLTKDKPKKLADDIIKTFCSFFNDTCLDQMFVQFILTDAVQKENAGMAGVFAVYRNQLKDLYKQANDLLLTNVKNAIGIAECFLTLPLGNLGNQIVSGHFRVIDKNISIDAKSYPQSSIMINEFLLPVIPLDYSGNSPMNEQCLRQWVRLLVHKLYNVNAVDDVVIYIVLSIVFRVVQSPVDLSIKNSYRNLGTIMLKKKRMNSDTTELARLENGELPTPNSGKIESFYAFMETIKPRLELTIHPMTLWYAVCLAMNNPALASKQLLHCRSFIEVDFPGVDPVKLLDVIIVPHVTCHTIPFETVLDYNCLITMEDTSTTGGYRFLPHTNLVGTNCCPVYVLSEEGHRNLLSNLATSLCPICYTQLTAASFQHVDKKPPMPEMMILPPGTPNIFTMNNGSRAAASAASATALLPPATVAASSAAVYSGALTKRGTLVIMKGTVGVGKTTYSTKLKERVEAMDGQCIVVGTDKYCKTGMALPEAVARVKADILAINNLPDKKLLVVVIDTCGEKVTGNTIFDVNFTGWNKVNAWPNLDRSKMDGYLAWSLRNVLQRGAPNEASSHNLNPITTTTDVCVSVHKKKAQALFGKKIQSPASLGYGRPKEEIIAIINSAADTYQAYLDATIPIDAAVEKFINKKIIKQ